MSEFVYREIMPSRNINGENFAQGIVDFNFQTGNPTAWIPSKSYFRISMEIRGDEGKAQPLSTENIAFADNPVSCLFNNCYFRAGGQDVSSIVNYVPQASQAKMRLQKTGAWLSSIGKDAYMLESSYAKRISSVSTTPLVDDDYEKVHLFDDTKVVCTVAIAITTGAVTASANSGIGTRGLKVGDLIFANGFVGTITTAPLVDGTGMIVQPFPNVNIDATTNCYGLKKRNGGSRNKTYALWQPPIGIFDHDKPMGAGDYRIQLNPNADYKQACVESFRSGLKSGTATTSNFDVIITDLRFYLATIKTTIPQGIETLYLMEVACQSKQISNGSTQEFTVPSSTRGLAVFVQAQKAGTDNRIPPTSFKCLDGSESSLQGLQITYANCTKPSTRWDSNYSETSNGMLQRYIDSQMESGLINSSGGAESFKDWMQRGAMYYYSFERDALDKSTQLQVAVNYSGALDSTTQLANLFVVAFYTRASEITTNNGSVVSVRSLTV